MPIYKAPLRDQQFVAKELIGLEKIRALPAFSQISDDLIDAILTEAEKLCVNTLLPINQVGDREGCRLENRQVYTPTGFKEAYKTFVENGWAALIFPPELGGQGVPEMVTLFVEEMICSTNLSFGLYPGLTRGAALLLAEHGSDELKKDFLPKLVSGEWTGTMCLTEPHCGTDLGILRTKATPQADGSYKLTGTKIFISAGDHDMTDNIIHFVLARTPDGPAGIRGVSLFLVPKFSLTDNSRNAVYCSALEHKMGIKASSTCVMEFEDATGFLVGEKFKGVASMFTMMNAERLAVGTQGLGLSEIAYQNALLYARERLQGRALSGVKSPEKPADPIIVHPDVRRMLMTMKATNEGNRMLAAWVALSLDIANTSKNPQEAQDASDFVQLMTPIIKALLTDSGSEMANIGVQIFGGHGYIQDHGMEQFVRDARIAQLYEGTNGIQALDLLGRKVPAFTGRYLRQFFHPVQTFLEEKMGDERVKEFVEPVLKAFARLQQSTIHVAQRGLMNPDEVGAVSCEYLRLFGLVACGYLWARSAEIALSKIGGDEDMFYQGKLDTARFFMQKLLPQNTALFASIMAGSKPIMAMSDASFGPF